MAQAAALYRKVFGYTDPCDGVSPRLLRGLLDNGGLVLGALDTDGTVVGFAYGFRGSDALGEYHYSQAAVVAADFQGLGLGRRLKLEQAKMAAAQGLAHMRWAYDPVQVRNAHFNLNVLGAYGIKFASDYYDDGNSDRVIVQWDLSPTGATTPPASTPSAGSIHEVVVNRNIPQTRASHPGLAKDMSIGLGNGLAAGFGQGLILTSCELNDPETATYVFSTAPHHGASPHRNGRTLP